MSWHPRDLAAFKMPQVTMPADIGQPTPAAVLPAGSFVNIGAHNRSPNVTVIDGLGIGGQGLALMPFDVNAASLHTLNPQNAPYVEYKLNLSKGERRIVVKCLPTHRIYDGLGLQYAISVNGGTPQIVNVDAAADTPQWSRNVLRGYSTGETKHPLDASGQVVIRLYLLDPGLVVNELDIF
jgi:hypothetical protein